jgi:hypothetical protein
MQQSSSREANSCPETQEIPQILQNPEVHNDVQKSLQPVLILTPSYVILVHPLPPSFLNADFSVSFTCTLRSSKSFRPVRFYSKIFYVFLMAPMHATCSSHLFHYNLVTLIMFGEGYILWTFLFLKMAVFWYAPCSLVLIDKCFRGVYSFHRQDGE